MGIIVIHKAGEAQSTEDMSAKVRKEIEYWGRFSGTFWQDGNTVRYRRIGKSVLVETTPGLDW